MRHTFSSLFATFGHRPWCGDCWSCDDWWWCWINLRVPHINNLSVVNGHEECQNILTGRFYARTMSLSMEFHAITPFVSRSAKVTTFSHTKQPAQQHIIWLFPMDVGMTAEQLNLQKHRRLQISEQQRQQQQRMIQIVRKNATQKTLVLRCWYTDVVTKSYFVGIFGVRLHNTQNINKYK